VLQQENRDLPGVRVTSVAPGSVRTSIYSSAVGGREHDATPPPPSTSPRTVARAVRAAAARGSREHDVDAVGGLGNKVLATAFTVAPGVFDRLVGPLVRTLSTTARSPAVGPGRPRDHP
jgi:short-subunit dehydrogenase